MKNKNTIKVLIAFSLVLFLVAVFTGSLYAAPKEKKAAATKEKKAEVKPWDCAGCHKDKRMIFDNHVATKDMPYEGCLVCHIPGKGNAETLTAKIPGSHLHSLN